MFHLDVNRSGSRRPAPSPYVFTEQGSCSSPIAASMLGSIGRLGPRDASATSPEVACELVDVVLGDAMRACNIGESADGLTHVIDAGVGSGHAPSSSDRPQIPSPRGPSFVIESETI